MIVWCRECKTETVDVDFSNWLWELLGFGDEDATLCFSCRLGKQLYETIEVLFDVFGFDNPFTFDWCLDTFSGLWEFLQENPDLLNEDHIIRSEN